MDVEQIKKYLEDRLGELGYLTNAQPWNGPGMVEGNSRIDEVKAVLNFIEGTGADDEEDEDDEE